MRITYLVATCFQIILCYDLKNYNGTRPPDEF